MKTLVRCLVDHTQLWRAWLPAVVVAIALPPLAVAMPLVEKRLIDQVLIARQLNLLAGTVALYAVLWLLASILGIARSLFQTYLGGRVSIALRERLLAHSEALSLTFWNRTHSGRTMVLFLNDVSRFAGLLSTTMVAGVSALVALALGIGVMVDLNLHLALATVLIAPVVAIVGAVATKPLRPAVRRVQDKISDLGERLQENLAGVREIVAFGREEIQKREFGRTLNQLLTLQMRVAVLGGAIQVGQTVASVAMTVVIFGFGGYLYLHGAVTLGTIVAMRALFDQMFLTTGQVFGLIQDVQSSLASVDRVYAFLDERPAVQDRPGAREISRISGRVTFEDVSFEYQLDRPVLQDISFEAAPGAVVALVGPSGAGKSTLVSLLARFYDPVRGRILFDGADLRDLKIGSLRGQVGMVFQNTFLFSGTVRENIALGGLSATEDEIVGAARTANAWEFIETLPEGLDTPVGERGVQLSEGQRQRIAIARAILRDPPILILDEPTSALDARSEHLLQTALARLMRGRTTFVIAHRLATIQAADQILVLDGGRKVEEGTHRDLLARDGLYRELHDLQFGHPERAPYFAELVPMANEGI